MSSDSTNTIWLAVSCLVSAGRKYGSVAHIAAATATARAPIRPISPPALDAMLGRPWLSGVATTGGSSKCTGKLHSKARVAGAGTPCNLGDARMLYGKEHVDRYVATDGEEGYTWRNGTEILILTTKGRKSGQDAQQCAHLRPSR